MLTSWKSFSLPDSGIRLSSSCWNSQCFLISSKHPTHYVKISSDRFISKQTSPIYTIITDTAWFIRVCTNISQQRNGVKGSSCPRNLKRLEDEWWEGKSLTCSVSKQGREMLKTIFRLYFVWLTWQDSSEWPRAPISCAARLGFPSQPVKRSGHNPTVNDTQHWVRNPSAGYTPTPWQSWSSKTTS